MAGTLAQMLVSNEPILVDISCHFRYRKNKYGVLKLEIIDDEKLAEILEDPKQKDEVEVINTKWQVAGWEIQNNIISDAQDIDPMTNSRIPNWNRYRDLRMRKLIFAWDLINPADKKPLPLTDKFLSKVPAEIMLALFDKYERSVGPDAEEQGK